MTTLTIQIYEDGTWIDAMNLRFEDAAAGFAGACSFGYTQEYILKNYLNLDSMFAKSVSVGFPISWDSSRLKHAPAFLHDITPAGSARRSLMKRLGRERPEGMAEDLFLLWRCTPAPIGHMRIKESINFLNEGHAIGFSREDVVSRNTDFLEYAYEQGAAIGGATGAGGEAPKLLMTEGEGGQLFPDAVLSDSSAIRHWFVKFPRGRNTPRDQDILRSEYCYYMALNKLGIPTIEADGLSLEEAEKPSLWMPRFDRGVYPLSESPVSRHAVESIYSMTGVTEPGSYMDHFDVIRMLAKNWVKAGQAHQVEDMVSEYLRRDLLNKVLGNSDNHGRNISVIKGYGSIHLAPIYDLAPMVLDDEGITRTTKWANGFEVAGTVNWIEACKALSDIADPDALISRLMIDAEKIRALPDILNDLGLPELTMKHPGVHLMNLEQRLKDWGLK